MQHVLFVSSKPMGDESVTRMFNAVQHGMRSKVYPLQHLPELKETDIPVFFAGCMGENLAGIAAIMAEKRPFVMIDHAWFGDSGIRGNYFRVVANAFQPTRLMQAEPDWDRYHRLGLPLVQPWRQDSTGKVLFLPHTEKLGEIFQFSPFNLKLWVSYSKLGFNWQDATVRGRHAEGPRTPPEEVILSHRTVIGFNTEMLLKAQRLGIPSIGHPQGSVVYAFNGLKPADLDTPRLYEKTVEERENLCATLATHYQGSLEELAQPGFIEALVERQLAA